MIDEKEVTAYVTMPDCFLQGCSEDIVIFRADGGNHFTDYGIYEGMFLFFDRKKRFKKGNVSFLLFCLLIINYLSRLNISCCPPRTDPLY